MRRRRPPARRRPRRRCGRAVRISPSAFSCCSTAFIVGRRAPSISASDACVSEKPGPTRSWNASSQRAARWRSGCSALQAAVVAASARWAPAQRRTRSRNAKLLPLMSGRSALTGACRASPPIWTIAKTGAVRPPSKAYNPSSPSRPTRLTSALPPGPPGPVERRTTPESGKTTRSIGWPGSSSAAPDTRRKGCSQGRSNSASPRGSAANSRLPAPCCCWPSPATDGSVARGPRSGNGALVTPPSRCAAPLLRTRPPAPAAPRPAGAATPGRHRGRAWRRRGEGARRPAMHERPRSLLLAAMAGRGASRPVPPSGVRAPAPERPGDRHLGWSMTQVVAASPFPGAEVETETPADPIPLPPLSHPPRASGSPVRSGSAQRRLRALSVPRRANPTLRGWSRAAFRFVAEASWFAFKAAVAREDRRRAPPAAATSARYRRLCRFRASRWLAEVSSWTRAGAVETAQPGGVDAFGPERPRTAAGYTW